MARIVKSQKGRLVVYLPPDVVNGLELKEGDEVSFFRGKGGSFIFAKNSDVAMMLGGEQAAQVEARPEQRMQLQVTGQDVEVLKKMDTLRYDDRTVDNVNRLLSEQERRVLQMMVLSGFVGKFRKGNKELYSISKQVYDRYLMRKRPVQASAQQAGAPFKPSFKAGVTAAARQQQKGQDEDVSSLEREGFVVLPTEAEASRVSLLLEHSIRTGQVLGTRSFSKDREFYIVMRGYFDRHGSAMLKKLREKDYRVADLSRELGMDENGARAVLYLLAESGDVMERRRDMFTLA